MSIETDFHSHVVRSSPAQMVQRAREMDLHVLGLSEHIFQMREARPLLPHMPEEGPFLTFDEYIARSAEAAERSHMDVRVGLEVDFVPEKHAAITQALADHPWDFLIGSVHEVDGLLFEWSRDYTRATGEALWLRYFELLRQAVASDAFSLVSHPVRMRATNAFLPAHLDDELEQLAAEAARHDVALEVNGYDVLHYPSLVKHLVRACALHHTPISVGSDAHDPTKIAQGHQLSAEILHEANIQRVRTWRCMAPEESSV